MTFPLVERVRRLAEKATKGEWLTRRALNPSDGGYDYAIGALVDGSEHCIAECFEIVDRGPTRVEAQANAAFIAAMRTDAPALADVAEQALKALTGLLEYEREGAKLRGLSDCTCVNRSEAADSAYENDNCPHQIARRVLALAEKE